MRAFLAFTILLSATPLTAQTNAPISAIDWLSQPGLAPLSLDQLVGQSPSKGAILDEITVTELDTALTEAYGLIPASISGIPQDFWTDMDPKNLNQIIRSLSGPGLPATNDLLLRALLAVTLGNEAVLIARVQALIDHGAIHAAYNLLGQSQIDSLEIFELFAETALLSDNVEQMCRQLNIARHLSNNEALQVYCQARVGTRNTAVLNYFTLNTLGAFTPTISALLAADLDPELADDLHLEQVDTTTLNALEFKLRASVGQPVETSSLPLKFASSDLSTASDWGQQIGAANRLSAVGSMPALQLLERYKSQKISGTGDVWSHVIAVQKLDRALADPIINPSKELIVFWNLMEGSGLQAPFARAWANKLIKLGKAPKKNKVLFQMQVLASSNTYKFKPTMALLHDYKPEILSDSYKGLMLQLQKKPAAPIPFRSANMLRGMRLISDALLGNKLALLEAISLYQAMGLAPLAQQLAMEFMILATVP